MEIILVTGYTALFLFFISRWKFFRLTMIPLWWLQGLFILKVIAGFLLGLVYTYYYTDRSTADTFRFFEDSRVLFRILFEQPKEFFQIFFGVNSETPECFRIYSQMNAWNNKDVLFNDNKTLVRLNVLFQFASVGSYYVHVVFLNFLSFTGLISLFKLFQKYVPGKSRLLFVAMMFMPSVLFWGSGLLKDGLLLFALGLLLYSYNNLLSDKYTGRSVLAFILSFILLLITKFYTLIIIIPALVAWYWSRQEGAKRIAVKFLFCYAIYLFLGFNVDLISEKYDVIDLIYYKQRNFNELASTTLAKSTIKIPLIDPTPLSILSNIPGAIVRIFIRPSLADAHSPFILMSAIENIFILLAAIICILFLRKDGKINYHIFWFSIFFVLSMYALIGLITPVLGAIVRYKVPALLFLVFLFTALLDEKKFSQKFPFAGRLLFNGSSGPDESKSQS